MRSLAQNILFFVDCIHYPGKKENTSQHNFNDIILLIAIGLIFINRKSQKFSNKQLLSQEIIFIVWYYSSENLETCIWFLSENSSNLDKPRGHYAK
jgi:hypothetical protein